jgi:anthranilate phosphoribosyltransferase
MQAAVGAVMDGQATEAEIAALLTALRMKGETVEEVVGAARAMSDRAVRIETGLTGLLDTCGTGGDRLSTFNISTATAFVVAATGVPVAKHGNRGVSSNSGSADVLEALGVNIQLSPEQIVACLHEVGLAFCFAPLLHEAMKHAAPVRKQLGFRTIFNLLGPLTNPAGAEFQLLGCNRPETAELLAQALRQLGRTRAIVVCGAGGLDEVSLWGETIAFVVEGDSLKEERWTAEMFGLPPCEASDLRADSAMESAAIIRRVFAGEAGPHRHIVLANAAAALRAAGRATDPHTAVESCRQVLDAGKARELCERLAAWTNAAN